MAQNYSISSRLIEKKILVVQDLFYYGRNKHPQTSVY